MSAIPLSIPRLLTCLACLSGFEVTVLGACNVPIPSSWDVTVVPVVNDNYAQALAPYGSAIGMDEDSFRIQYDIVYNHHPPPHCAGPEGEFFKGGTVYFDLAALWQWNLDTGVFASAGLETSPTLPWWLIPTYVAVQGGNDDTFYRESRKYSFAFDVPPASGPADDLVIASFVFSGTVTAATYGTASQAWTAVSASAFPSDRIGTFSGTVKYFVAPEVSGIPLLTSIGLLTATMFTKIGARRRR